MKMKEKGIDPSTQHKGPRTSNASGGKRFNAFREMELEAKRARGELPPAEERSKKNESQKPKRSDPLEFEFNGKKLVTKPDGTVEASEVAFPENSVLRFTGAGEGGDWKDLKVSLDARLCVPLHPS